MERGDVPPSPTCSSIRDSAHSSQDFGRNAPRRSQYRLFPVVLPTPPASPVTLQRTSLTKASGSLRRRSSSVETATRAAASLAPTTTSPPSLQPCSLRDARKASLPELPQLRTVQESESLTETPKHLPSCPPASVLGRTSDDASLDTSRYGDAAHARDASSRSDSLAIAASPFGLPLSPVVENPRNPSSSRVRTKPKPNLRINIVKGDESTSRPSSPYSRLQRPYQQNAQAANHTSLQPTGARDVSEAKVRELNVSSDENRGRSMRKQPDSTHDLLSRSFMHKELPELPPPIQLPSTMASAPGSRPQTGDGGKGLLRDDTSLQRPSTGNIEPQNMGISNSQSRINLRNRLLPATLARSRQEPAVKARKPAIPQQPSSNDWKSLNPPTPRFEHFPTTDLNPDDHEHPMPALPDTFSNENLKRNDSCPVDASEVPSATYTISESPAFDSYTPSAALAAARAQVAALRDSVLSTGSSNGRTRGPTAAARSLSGRPPTQALPRPSSPTSADPVAALKTLSEECDTLHARYATLKAERQKISSGIITRLKEEAHRPDLASTLLDDQLSLAAASSSMDICIAKLKSLECRKEDAIAALIAKATRAQSSTVDNISAVIASLALSRKPSTTPSLGSSHYAPTGRSTPDIGVRRRLTQASTRTLSYGSEPENLDVKSSVQSRKQSLGSVGRSESIGKAAPATIIEVTESLQQEMATESQISRTLYQSVQDVLMNEDLRVVSAYNEAYDMLNESSSSRVSSVDSVTLLEELFHGQATRKRADGKAAKVLGLLDQPGHDELPPNLTLNFGNHDGEAASLLSVLTKNTTESSVYSDRITPSEMERQLQSFPRPKSSGSLLDDQRTTRGSCLTMGSSAESSAYDPSTDFDRVSRGVVKATHPSHPMKKRDPSAHTIKVFLHDDELLHYYNTMPRRI